MLGSLPVVYRVVDKYRFEEGEVFPRFTAPSYNSEADKLASELHLGGCKTGKYFSLFETVFVDYPIYYLQQRGRGGIPIRNKRARCYTARTCDASSNKQVRVVDAWPERKLRKEL